MDEIDTNLVETDFKPLATNIANKASAISSYEEPEAINKGTTKKTLRFLNLLRCGLGDAGEMLWNLALCEVGKIKFG